MKKRNRFYVSALLLLFLFPVLAKAQANTGILTGTVVDEDGQPLPGVDVAISSPALITPQLSRVSNDQGFFRFPYLPPGTYTLTAKLTGFGTYKTENIVVLLNMTTELVVTMTAARLESEVLVVGAAPVVAVENTKLATNIDSTELKNLPVSRNVSAAFNLAPGILSGSSFGSGTRENSWNMDGVQVTDPGSGSGMSATQSMDAYEEVQIETAAHPAEFGNAGGAVINVITRSGGNAFHGEGSVYYTDSKLQALNIEGTPVSAPTTKTLYNYGFNFTLGGPVIKDKIWFFASSGYAPSKQRLDGFAEDVPYKTYNPMGKLTFQPALNHRISASFTYNKTLSPYFYAGRYRTPEACFNTTIQSYAYNVNWLWTISPSSILEVRAFHLYRPTDYLSRGRSVIYYDLGTSVMSGSSNDCLQERLRWQSNATLTQYVDNLMGSHEFKAGFEFERGESRNAANYFPDQYGMSMYYMLRGRPVYAIKYEPAQVSAQIDPYKQYAGFVQDTWKISRYIVANLGFRYNYVDAYTPPQQQQTIRIPVLDWKTFEPRLALGVDPFGDGKTGIKLSYSHLAHMMWTWFYSLNPNGAKSTMYFVVRPGVFIPMSESEPYAFELDPNLKRPYVEEWVLSLERAITNDLGLKLSYVDRNNKKIVTYTDLNRTEDWYVPVEVTNPFNGQTMTVYDISPDAPLATLDYYTNDPRAKNHYRGIVLELDKKLSHNYQFRLSYNYSFSRVNSASNGFSTSGMMGVGYFSDPNFGLNDFGLYDDTMHVIKFQGIWYAPLGIILSANYRGQSGYQYENYFPVELDYYGYSYFAGEKLGSRRMPFLHYLDVRIGKDFNIRNAKLSLFVDLYNALNLNETTSIYSMYGSSQFGKVTGIQSGRLAQFGARIQF